jgi:hypothetical protein
MRETSHKLRYMSRAGFYVGEIRDYFGAEVVEMTLVLQ